MQSPPWIKAVISASTFVCIGCESSPGPSYEGPNPYVTDRNAATGTGYGGVRGASIPGSTGSSADIVLLSTDAFDGYLADADDRALYMFANDVPGAASSACSDTCLDKWPVFDVKDVSVSEGLTSTDFARFLRADGSWQTSFKGHPLYYFAMDGDTGEVSGDGIGGRWFVARDYFAFLGAKADLTPEGATEPAPYLTNRAGRTSYIFLKDTVGRPDSAPVSACTDACLDSWPVWTAPPSLEDLIVPSIMEGADFEQFERVVGGMVVNQLSYRGWPLYYYAPDPLPGQTTGHLTGAWRAIEPSSFAETGIAGTVPDSSY